MSCFGMLPPASICYTQPSADPGLGPGGGPVLPSFLVPTPTQTAQPIFTLYGSNDMLWLAQVSPRTVLLGIRRRGIVTSFGGNVPQKPTQRGVNRHFQAKLPKSKNCNISETVHAISTKFDDGTHTINDMSWVVHRYRA